MRRWPLRILLGCRPGEHLWRRLYGDERMHRGAMFACKYCGRRTDDMSVRHVDPAQDMADALKRRTGVPIAPSLAGRVFPSTVCDVCADTFPVTLQEHLAERHTDLAFAIYVDPATATSRISPR